ncbi:MAG: aldose 1-epimerase family protein [Aigarchaeota archaeon]|nr:aldose 1-epimerase family protein [Candidatus Calditenuaceae archaeon]
MTSLFGMKLDKETLERHVGDLSQVGGVSMFQLADGPEKGVRCISLKTGPLAATIVVDRAMDIANLEYKGIPLAWISPTGIKAPAFYEPEGLGWLRGFFGGALTTCGLTYFGRPTVDEGEQLGLHGRVSYTPARLKLCRGRWIGDEYLMEIEGEVREVKVFEPNISLHRRIEARLGETRILIKDTVSNNGWSRQPFMILYHFNFGYPLLSKDSKLMSTSRLVVPRDQDAAEGAEYYDSFDEPQRGYREKVYFHDLAVDSDGYAYAALVNKRILDGLAVSIRFRKSSLNRLIEWKMMGEGTYVLGIEPANALVLGRDAERRYGTLQFLEPREEREIEVELSVVEGREEIKKLEERIKSVRSVERPKILKTIDEFVDMTR